MSDDRDYDALRGSPLTAELSDEQVQALEGIAYCRKLNNDEVLIEEGKIDNSLHVITSGNLAVMRDLSVGEPVVLHLLRSGDLAGELGFIDGLPHTATLRSIGESTVCSIEREALETLIPEDPWVVYRLMQNIVRSVHNILNRMNTQYVEMSNYITKQHGRY